MNLTPSSCIALTDWQLIRVSGKDKQAYLQSQVTADINLLTEKNALFAAHCDPKGKMWSNLLLFMRDGEIFYIVRNSVADKQMSELKKYAIFSKVSIEKVAELHLIGLINDAVSKDIAILFAHQNCITHKGITYIKLALPYPRIIMISQQPPTVDMLPSEEWLKRDLEAGYPIIDAPNMGTLLPQACNLHQLNAISFEKGCYCGQEMVARAQYRGANKRGMYLLSGIGEVLPVVGDAIECQVGGNWRETGQILASFKQQCSGENNIYVQIVLNNGIDITTAFRIKGQPNSRLKF